MKLNQVVWKYAIVLGCLIGTSAFAAGREKTQPQTVTDESYRMARRAGMYVAYGDPYPTVLGVGVAYQLTDFLRAQAGFGKISVTNGITISASGITTQESSATTVGLGLKGMVPGWNFTPTVGLHFSHLSYSSSGISVGGFTESGSHVYTSLGFDWQAQGGFNLTGGYQLSFKSGIGGGLYLGAGWFVDWLG